tara:strand:- start:632 stop:1609 length:978 start_codon:yes stop_codon:yes gene_type:complete
MSNEEFNYNDLLEAGAETPTLDTKSEEDPKLYQDAEGKHAKIDTDKGTEGKITKNRASIAAKLSTASGKIETPPASGTPQERLEQTLDALFDGENLSEEFMVKTATIFEAAINERVSEIESIILEKYENVLEEHIQEVSSELAEKLDDYLGYVVEQWMETNELSVETGIRADIAENFISGLKNLFDENYIDVPDEKYDIIEDVVTENQELKNQLNEFIENNIELRQSLLSHRCSEIFYEEAEGLIDTDVERYASLAEGVEFENEDQYREKIQIIKESYFNNNLTSSDNLLTEEGSEDSLTINNSPVMDSYMKTIHRHATDSNKTF